MASLNKINARLDALEAAKRKPVLGLQVSDASLDKFSIAEAIADSLFGSEFKEKACTFEPNGKPCDHCSMCNSRGF